MSANRTRPLTRCLRLMRLTAHLAKGLGITLFKFRGMSKAARDASIRRWSRQLLHILAVTIRKEELKDHLPESCLIVANHISWIDVFVLLATAPAVFVAKSEIRSWPFLGTLCARAGTLFIERGKRSSARHARATVRAALTSGALVNVFPEGTTSDGHVLLPFHAALFQPAIDAHALIQPVALRYTDSHGHYSSAPNFIGDTTFVSSVWSIVGAVHTIAEMNVLQPIAASGRERRELARASQDAIAAALGVPVRGSRPGTSADLPGESQ